MLTDATCEGKAVLVARGDGLRVRNLVLARARVPDGNGAGIRLEGQGLTLDGVRFRNDEVGVLAGAGGAGSVVVRDCVFEGGGTTAPGPSAAVVVGASCGVADRALGVLGCEGRAGCDGGGAHGGCGHADRGRGRAGRRGGGAGGGAEDW